MNKWVLYGVFFIAGVALAGQVKGLPVIGSFLSKLPG
jgi:hypothetical protein